MMTATETKERSISSIANDIRRNWPNVYFGAKPYLTAMFSLTSIEENYFEDSASSVVRYFLSNATTWRGEHARRIKAELNAMLKAHDA